ncbi:zinc finger protein aebp2-like [Argiope bruennichi]|uniref:zinc finger protein aebp2-like n=1 Tax=Argiope bruennichi TaxID=94029 RepID=UPI002493DC6D|nr:zinc finger protein aebp2-like [Argiope bruennichi]
MAASGLVELAEAAAIEMSMNRKIPLVQLVNLKGYFQDTYEKNGVRNGSNITKCFEQLNGGLPTKDIDPYLKTSLARNFSEFFAKESFNNRLGRSPSTDSIAVSNFSSGPGSVDSCQYSSNGSDSNSGSSPCSPEDSDPCSRAGSPHSMPPTSPANHYCSESEEQLSQTEQNFRTDDSTKSNGSSVFEENGNTFLSEQTECSSTNCENVQLNNSNSDNIKHFYLPESSCSVPNSNYEPFQNFKSSNCQIPSSAKAAESSEMQSVDKTSDLYKSAGHSNSMHQTDSKLDFSSSNTSTNQSNCSSTDMQQCSWVHCNTYLEGNTELVEHIRTQHVQVQKEKENFVCLWVGCKVYNRSSCSLSWLERHILTHGGSKPFKCIVDNCNQRFPTQSALQRHVNSHFDSHPNNHSGKTGRCRDETTSKSFRRKKHHKYKKRSAIGKTEDFFDSNIMEQIRYKLVEIHSGKPLGSTNNPYGFITLHSRVKAIRTDKSGEVKVLLQWMPENILPDCWVSEESALCCKKVPYSSLPRDVLVSLNSQLREECDDSPRVKQRRK